MISFGLLVKSIMALSSNGLPIVIQIWMPKGPRNAEFIDKLCHMLQHRQQSICWAGDGRFIQLIDEEELRLSVLPEHFRHSNMASFVRQLNMYGFKKVALVDQQFYQHDQFFRGNQHKFYRIRRQPQKGVTLIPLLSMKSDRGRKDTGFQELVRKLVTFQYHAKRKTQNMANVLENMKKQLERVRSKEVRRNMIRVENCMKEIELREELLSHQYQIFLECPEEKSPKCPSTEGRILLEQDEREEDSLPIPNCFTKNSQYEGCFPSPNVSSEQFEKGQQ